MTTTFQPRRTAPAVDQRPGRTLTRDQAARGLAQAIRKADAAVYTVRQQERSMMPNQYQRAILDARTRAQTTIREARAALDAAIATERAETRRTLTPTAEQAARATMYATQGMALAGAGMADLERGIRDQLAAGNRDAAREYLRAGGSRLQAHLRESGRSEDFHTLTRAAATETESKRAGMLTGLDRYEQETARLDSHLRGLTDRLGNGDLDPDDPDASRHDLARVVDLWHDTAEGTASDAGVAVVEQHQAAAQAHGVTE
jgi:hypothetical protein